MGSLSLLLEKKKNVGEGRPFLSDCQPAVNGFVTSIDLPALRLISGPRSNIPIFDGCERGALVDDWLFKAEQVANLRGLTDAEKLEAFVPRLTGEARKFHSTKLAQIKDYDEWRQMMVAKFSTFFSKSFYLKQLETVKQKPNQSVRVFAREIDSLFVKALGLNVVSDRSLRGLKCRIKLIYLIKRNLKK